MQFCAAWLKNIITDAFTSEMFSGEMEIKNEGVLHFQSWLLLQKRESMCLWFYRQVSWLVTLPSSFSSAIRWQWIIWTATYWSYLQLRDSPWFAHGSFLFCLAKPVKGEMM